MSPKKELRQNYYNEKLTKWRTTSKVLQENAKFWLLDVSENKKVRELENERMRELENGVRATSSHQRRCTPKSDTSEEAEWNGEIQKVAERNFGEKRV